MNKRLCFLVVIGSVISMQGFAAKERVIRFQNHVRVGYDDNVNMTDNKDAKETGYLTNISQITGKFIFSSRTEAIIFWQPEFRYRFSADPKLVSYQDLYARLDHAISQRLFMTLSDRLRYQDREAQRQGVKSSDQNYLDNDLQGSLTFTLSSLSNIKVAGGYMTRTWDDDIYGEVRGNNFDKVSVDASFVRQIFNEKVDGLVGVNYSSLNHEGQRGGYNSVAAYLGIDQIFNPKLTAYGRFGYQASTVDTLEATTAADVKSSADDSSPYAQGGFDYAASARTSFNGALGYSLTSSENSLYNAQNRLNLGLGMRHDITAKINVSATLSYFYSMYDSDYTTGISAVSDAEDHYTSLALRATYQINRNNFFELGYIYSTRKTNSSNLTDYDRNRVELGWKLRL